MVVLAAIGRFFKKIWEWIKNTAWIQPLLIVGIIFGIIFSIQPISNAIKNGNSTKKKYKNYYHNFQISLEYNGKDASGNQISEVDTFTTLLEDVMDSGSEAAISAFKNKFDNLGNKFFVAYVAQDCTNCEAAIDGFDLFDKKLNGGNGDKSFVSEKYHDFNMVTIYTDEETSYTTDDETAFVQYLEDHQSFYETVGSNAYNSDYYVNGKYNEGDLTALETADPNEFSTPTIFLVELDPEGLMPGVTEVMFGVSGDDENAKAKTLLDCWNHTGDFTTDPEKK